MKVIRVNKIKQFITARRISLGLILLLAALMYVSTLVPQEIDSTPVKIEAWRRTHGWLLWLVDGTQLNNVYSQPWFALIILFAAVTLGISSFDQMAAARKKLYSTSIGAADNVAESVTEQALRSAASSHHYRPLTLSNGHLKFVRSPWGYFGVLMLHIGITLVVVVSLYVSLTGRQGVLILVKGDSRDNRQPWDASEHGIASSPLILPGTIRLDRVMVNFDSKNRQPEVSSDISIIDQTGSAQPFSVSINKISRYKGLRIYQTSQYGDMFTVTFTDRSGESHTEKIMAQQAAGPALAGYSEDFSLVWSPYLFAAKYFADVAKKNMMSTDPELVIRVLDGKREIARTSLTRGVSGTLGEYRVRFDRVEKWAKLIIVDIKGMSAVFAGFAVIMLGGLIHYMTPPRELTGVKRADGTYGVYWKAVAFKEFYKDERDDVARELTKETNS